jgi:Uncharacterized protein conserved in bacteria
MKHAFARTLRREQTDVERKLWYALRGRRLGGFKFRRQQPIGPYIADFVCFEAKLIVELDGEQHGEAAHTVYDRVRTERLKADGFRVLRFWNGELIENFDGVLEGIERALKRPSQIPPPPF